MKWGLEELRDLDLAKMAKDSPYPFVIHWAGLKHPRIKAMIRSDILLFFEDYYYSKIRFGKTKSRCRVAAEFLAAISDRAIRKAKRLHLDLTIKTPDETSPEGSVTHN